MNRIGAISGALLGVLAAASTAPAAWVGTDDAAASAYSDGWANLDDGTSGGDPDAFGQWFLGGDGIHSIGDSTQLAGGSGGDINVLGESFRLQSISGSYADAYRFLDPAGLSVGQTFTMDLAVNYRGGFKGIDLRGAGDETLFNFNIGGDDYVVGQAQTGNGSIGNAYSNNTIFHLAFAQTSAAGGLWSITRGGGLADFDTGTFTGVARSIKLYNGGQGSSAEDDLFANRLSIVPEPVSLVMFGLAGLVLLGRHGRSH
jgi:hypothetical protein